MEEDSTVQRLFNQGGTKMRHDEGRRLEGRMEIEYQDYPGTGPNHSHDPKSPGKA